MAKLKWDATGEKKFESGIDHVVLYLLNEQGEYTPGIAWNGITSVAETPEGAEPESQYADNIKYLTMVSAEELNGTIEAFMAPPEWAQCDGNAELAKGLVIGQQSRKPFGLCYRTKIGDDVNGQDAGYKLHMIYGAQASPSERTYETLNESPEAASFSWEFSTTPIPVEGHNPTSLATLDSTTVSAAAMKRVEDVLYGTDGGDGKDGEEARLPTPDEIAALLTGDEVEAQMARMSSKVRMANM